MTLPKALDGRLRLPAIVAPMFLISGPDLVVECCKAGLVGTFPALNQRSSEGFRAWVREIRERLAGHPGAAPFGVNLIVHRSNPRVEADLRICTRKPGAALPSRRSPSSAAARCATASSSRWTR